MKRAPAFWWQPGIGVRAALLAPAAFVYGRIARRRLLAPATTRVSVPVLCVGNFVAGGAGKTPTVIALARLLQDADITPVIVTRGYGGSAEGPLEVDVDRHTAPEVGDEALLLAEVAPTIVAKDRGAGARAAEEAGAEIILLDDGFQNPALARDLALVVGDGATGVGNGLTMPAGPLRAPLADQLVLADALLVVGDGEGGARLVRRAARRGLAVLRADLVARPNPDIVGKRVIAFAGIGRPQKFYDTLRELDAEIAEQRSFPDHHVFTSAEAQEILTSAEKQNLIPVTTAKDMRRLLGAEGELMRWLAGSARVVEVDLVFRDPARVLEMVRRTIRKRSFG